MSRSIDTVVVGLGAMGLPMARNLAAAGLEVVGVEPSAQRRADAAELTTVGALGHAPLSTTVLVMVADAEQLTAVVDDALAAGLDPRHLDPLGHPGRRRGPYARPSGCRRSVPVSSTHR